MSHCASRERSKRTAPTYAPIVSERSVEPERALCLDPPRRMYSANRVSVSVLYCTPPAVSGSTKGTLSVSAA
eukprot:5589429-Pleurochrysis_carterae.AAC.1